MPAQRFRRLTFTKGDKQHVLLVSGNAIFTLHTEDMHLPSLGKLEIKRASDVEFCEATQQWEGVIREEFRMSAHHHKFSHASREAVLDWERFYFDHVYQPGT